jgi:PIN domain nuclease of toxin-antitoxin system
MWDTSPLSLADRACIGAAIELDAKVVTADRARADSMTRTGHMPHAEPQM